VRPWACPLAAEAEDICSVGALPAVTDAVDKVVDDLGWVLCLNI
jgi:hypothetical protein